jgi:hypothetical protein
MRRPSGVVRAAWLVALAGCWKCDSTVEQEPPPAPSLPTDHAFILMFERLSSQAYVIDPAQPRLARGRPPRWAAPETRFRGDDGYIWGAWWRPAQQRIFVLAGRRDMSLVALGRDGHSELVLRQRDDELTAEGVKNGCALAPDASTLLCWGHQPIEGALPARYRTKLRLDSLTPGVPPRHVAWPEPVTEPGVIAPLGDAREVLYADTCPGEESGAGCVFRATSEGAARALVATLPGPVCAIAPSPDGRLAAVASRRAGDNDGYACSELNVITLDQPTRPSVRTSLRAPKERYFNYQGITAIAWSPDGAQLAVTSDHLEGCAGAEGVSACWDRPYVVDAAASGFRAVGGDDPSEMTSLVWLTR